MARKLNTKKRRAVAGHPEHVAGRQAQSDFTYMNELGVTLAGQPFKHLLYQLTLTYSNWEWGQDDGPFSGQIAICDVSKLEPLDSDFIADEKTN